MPELTEQEVTELKEMAEEGQQALIDKKKANKKKGIQPKRKGIFRENYELLSREIKLAKLPVVEKAFQLRLQEAWIQFEKEIDDAQSQLFDLRHKVDKFNLDEFIRLSTAIQRAKEKQGYVEAEYEVQFGEPIAKLG